MIGSVVQVKCACLAILLLTLDHYCSFTKFCTVLNQIFVLIIRCVELLLNRRQRLLFSGKPVRPIASLPTASRLMTTDLYLSRPALTAALEDHRRNNTLTRFPIEELQKPVTTSQLTRCKLASSFWCSDVHLQKLFICRQLYRSICSAGMLQITALCLLRPVTWMKMELLRCRRELMIKTVY